ncbi:MAG: hypothetical protein JWO06_1884 [Bacteroidota bacterium]|nr:hypothetical protein [Bacteroidota bacterium]
MKNLRENTKGIKMKTMKTISLNITLCLCLLLASVVANAKEDVNKPTRTNSHISFKTDAGNCVASTAQFDIDINNVRARLLAGGDTWWNFSEPKYEVPKGDGTHPLCAIFAGAIWISGLDAGGNLKCAAQRYRASGNDYWPGPLDASGNISPSTCSEYDRHFNVYGADIAKAQSAYLQNPTGVTLADIPKDVLAWPAKGNQYLAGDPTLIGQTYNVTDNLAPFKDVNHDGVYDPLKGDYPVIPCRNGESQAYADQMVFWVFNDVGNIHTESNGQSIGVQVNSLAFAFQTTDEINNMTFYNYEIVNKSANKLFQTYISQWVDPDLGCAFNDRVGCDTSRSLGVCYNGSSPDNDCVNEHGYLAQLPIVGVDFFEGPLSDSGAQLGMSSFVYFTNGAAFAKSDPLTAPQYRNYQTGFWNDGTPFTAGNTGYGGTTPTKYIFPGNPSDGAAWSECSVSSMLPADDRRFVQSSGPFTLTTGVSQFVTVGVVFVRPTGTNGVGLCPDFNTTIGPADDEAQALFNTCFKLLDGPDAPTLQIRELDNQLIINLLNISPISNNIGEGYKQVDGKTEESVHEILAGHGDSTYTFEGYKLYQLKSPNVSASDLEDPTKALLVAQCDVKNGITKLINFIKDPTLNLFIPTLEVDGADAGITNSFKVTTDLFATGKDNRLINHMTYYYTAVAYAYNDFQHYDQENPQAKGQLIEYLQGRNNFKVYDAVPHIPDPRNVGTILHSQWGDGVNVVRIEGQGNGGNNLDLTPETINDILNSGFTAFKDTLTYVKGLDPIGFQITDPVNLKEADFVLQFLVDSGATDTAYLPLDSRTYWKLTDVTNNVVIASERHLDRPYQQQIVDSNRNDYGFSIKLGTPAPVDTLPAGYIDPNSPPRFIYGTDVTKSSITYQNPTQPWLSFVQDQGTNTVTNWIRSGIQDYDPGSQSSSRAFATVFDDNWYWVGPGNPPTYPHGLFDDPNHIFDNILNGTWAPYCLTANYSHRDAVAPAPPYVYGPGFKWLQYGGKNSFLYAPPQNTLDKVASVDIVITPDKSKWTRCVVFETGEDERATLGNDIFPRSSSNSNPVAGDGALKGQIRMSYSKNWNNPVTKDYLVTDPSDIGRSWFPGYAVNVETGERLNIGFGEASEVPDQNGADMLWNPTQDVYDPVIYPSATIPQIPYFGGKHFIYVWDTKYDGGDSAQHVLLSGYDSITTVQEHLAKSQYPVYRDLMWTCIPVLTPGYTFGTDASNVAYIPPAEVTVRLRVDKPYTRMLAVDPSPGVDSLPRYMFSTKGLGATENNVTVAKSALDLIRIVPNPYLAYSAYEPDANTSTVKVTNLPNNCTITIYSLDGTIIRVLNRSIGVDPATNKKVEISDGTDIQSVNVESTVDWDMKNDKGIPIASGIYLFHIEAPGLGQRTLKWFGTVRPADTSNY